MANYLKEKNQACRSAALHAPIVKGAKSETMFHSTSFNNQERMTFKPQTTICYLASETQKLRFITIIIVE